MSSLNIVKRIVLLRKDIQAVREKLEHYERELDGLASELVEYLKDAAVEFKS
jgi:hypothetical protein